MTATAFGRLLIVSPRKVGVENSSDDDVLLWLRTQRYGRRLRGRAFDSARRCMFYRGEAPVLARD